jgi:uncharacterized protein YndB with AHSA1/START domain
MPGIHHALLIGSPVEKVYNAICTQEGLSEWWTPDATAKTELNSIARFPFGSPYFKEMKVIELKPYELIKWNCISGADEWAGTTISFKLLFGDKATISMSHPEMKGQIEQQPNDKITLLIFHHDNWKEDTLMYAECSYTWGQFLTSLKLLCETGKGRPWPNQHRIVS